MFNVKNIFASEVMKKLFVPKTSPYDIHNYNSLQKRTVNSALHITESVSYTGPKIWHLVPNEIEQSESKGGSFTVVHVEYAKYILGKWGL